ncbi:hypothetical protein NL676_030790 [Syzygium grande]|nr:hypothetical protein NL676_030790 [Syzygium grande]
MNWAVADRVPRGRLSLLRSPTPRKKTIPNTQPLSRRIGRKTQPPTAPAIRSFLPIYKSRWRKTTIGEAMPTRRDETRRDEREERKGANLVHERSELEKSPFPLIYAGTVAARKKEKKPKPPSPPTRD